MTFVCGSARPFTAGARRLAASFLPLRTRLEGLGWVFTEDAGVPASAVTCWQGKQIVFAPRVAARAGRRDRLYVTPHEMGHALDYEAGMPSLALARIIGVNERSAQEALGEAVAYELRAGQEERNWIAASIAYHLRYAKWRYSWAKVRAVATRDLAEVLVTRRDGMMWRWDGAVVRRRA